MTVWDWLVVLFVLLVIVTMVVGVIYERRESAEMQRQLDAHTEALLQKYSRDELLRMFEELDRKHHEDQPPKFAEFLLYIFLPKQRRDNLLGDLEEEYYDVCHRFGNIRAQIFYYSQVARSLWPLFASLIQKGLKWGILGWIGETIRRFIS